MPAPSPRYNGGTVSVEHDRSFAVTLLSVGRHCLVRSFNRERRGLVSKLSVPTSPVGAHQAGRLSVISSAAFCNGAR
jgi:hypothetical protein